MIPIRIETIPHVRQRYDTCGDWVERAAEGCGPGPGILLAVSAAVTIRVSDIGNEDCEFLVALHELIEWYLCRRGGITTAQVDAFDLPWRPHDGIDEPGDDPASPYYAQHRFALLMEALMGHELGVAPAAYEAAFARVPLHPSAGPPTKS